MELILLHGAIGSRSQLESLAETLRQKYIVHLLSFSGHGGLPLPSEPFSISLFADDVLAYMDAHGIAQTSIFGYSMGGYVALYLAKHFPARISKIITLATKFSWDDTIAANEVKMLDPEKIEQKLPAFAASLRDRHAPTDWKLVLKFTAEMMLAMGADNPLKLEDYGTLHHPVLVMLGDRDKMVSFEETVAVYKALPNAQLCVLPGTGHPIELVNLDFLNQAMLGFL